MLLIPPEQSESGNSKIKEVCGRDAATRDAVRKKKGEKRVRNKKKKKARVLVRRDSSQRYSFISGDGVIRGGLISGRS